MANLLGQNIGTNYKGILNLNTLNGNLSGTLQAVTDGDGNASPLQLSTTDLSVVQGVVSRLLISADITMRRSDNTLFFQYLNVPDVLELNGNTIRLNTLRGNTAIGHGVASARLHVRGDGTNNVARFENSAGTSGLFINPAGDYLGLIGNVNTGFAFGSNFIDLYTNNAAGASQAYFSVFGRNSSAVAGTTYGLDLGGVSRGSTTGFGLAATTGSANFRPLNLTYTINNSGAQTGTATGIFLNATETALNGMGHNLIDLQVGGVSQFRVTNAGGLTTGGNVISGANVQAVSTGYFILQNRILISSSSAGVLRIANNADTDFNRLQFGGTTNAFPALKRSAAELQCVLADDSGRADFRCKAINTTLITNSSDNIININNTQYVSTAGVSIANSTLNSSAILQADSTTRGFLPPRMTTTQKNAIATPTAGLLVYDTTLNKLSLYTGSAWETITSV